jgi:peptidoglycan/LPS O-acetylase OafA/YrhL
MVLAWLPFRDEPASAGDILLNLTFLFPVVPEKVTSLVPAGWSLGVEWVFYIAFPVFAILARSVRASVAAFAACVVIALIAAEYKSYSQYYETMSVLRNLMFFAAGLVAFALVRSGRRVTLSPHHAVVLVLATMLLLIFNRITFERPVFHPAFMFAAVCGLWVMCAYEGLPRWIDNRAARYIGRVSYSIYLVHPIVFVILEKSELFELVNRYTHAMHARFAIIGVIGFAATMLVATVAYKLVEAPGIRLGDRLLKRRQMHLSTAVPA